MTDYETGYANGESSAWADVTCMVDEQGLPFFLAHIGRNDLDDWVNELVALVKEIIAAHDDPGSSFDAEFDFFFGYGPEGADGFEDNEWMRRARRAIGRFGVA